MIRDQYSRRPLRKETLERIAAGVIHFLDCQAAGFPAGYFLIPEAGRFDYMEHPDHQPAGIPHDMLDEQITPLPREEGKEDIPQSDTEGLGKLYYSEQNFNALAAANSAMIAELAGATQIQQMLQANIAGLSEQLESVQGYLEQAQSGSAHYRDLYQEMKKRLEDGLAEAKTLEMRLESAEQQNHHLARQLERMKGYTDRVLDEEAKYDERQRPSPTPDGSSGGTPSVVGPRLGDVEPPRRRARGGAVMIDAFDEMTLRASYPERVRRAY